MNVVGWQGASQMTDLCGNAVNVVGWQEASQMTD